MRILDQEGKVIALIAKVSSSQTVSLISGRHVGVPRRGTNMVSPY